MWYTSTTPIIDYENGDKQKFTATSDSAISFNLSDGDDITLIVNPSTFTITWESIIWFGSVPAMEQNKLHTIVISKDGANLYGWWQVAS